MPDVGKATHIVYAYRLETRAGKITENFDSDRDWGTGYELLKMMRDNDIVNTVCIATRLCNQGHINIHKKRYTIINDCCLHAQRALSE